MPTVVTRTPLTIPFVVPDITDVLGTFNRLAFYRSRTGQNGLYEPATAPALASAVLGGSAVGPHQLNGKTLKFQVNGVTNVTVPFPGADPYTTADAAAAINGATALVTAAPDSDDRLVITTVATGSGASIEIQSSDAAPFLGFDVGAASVGLDAHLVLAGGTYQYFYTDLNSSIEFFYRAQFYHSVTLEVSELSVPITANQTQVVPLSQTAVAYAQLSDLSGKALAGRKITFDNVFQPNLVAGYGVMRQSVTIETDATGYAEVRLLKGAVVDVVIDGTNIVRRITVPDSGVDVFNILDPSLSVEDEFGIQQPDIDFLVRTS